LGQRFPPLNHLCSAKGNFLLGTRPRRRQCDVASINSVHPEHAEEAGAVEGTRRRPIVLLGEVWFQLANEWTFTVRSLVLDSRCRNSEPLVLIVLYSRSLCRSLRRICM
jgi:hypothetical protein